MVGNTVLVTESWTCRYFSQANPKGEGQGDVPALLRRLADTIESMGTISVQDIAFHTEVSADGPWHSMAVYFQAGDMEVDSDDADA